MQTLELLMVLQDLDYGAHGEIVGYDLYPYTEDQVGAVRRAILHFEFLWDLAAKIDRKAIADSRQRADALAGLKEVYSALGLDPTFEKTLTEQRRRAASDGAAGWSRARPIKTNTSGKERCALFTDSTKSGVGYGEAGADALNTTADRRRRTPSALLLTIVNCGVR